MANMGEKWCLPPLNAWYNPNSNMNFASLWYFMTGGFTILGDEVNGVILTKGPLSLNWCQSWNTKFSDIVLLLWVKTQSTRCSLDFAYAWHNVVNIRSGPSIICMILPAPDQYMCGIYALCTISVSHILHSIIHFQLLQVQLFSIFQPQTHLWNFESSLVESILQFSF